MIPLNLAAAVPVGVTARKCQLEALEAINASTSPAPLVDMIMGSGKSILIVMLVRSAIAGGARHICVAAPTEALVEQLAEDLRKYIGKNRVGRYYGKTKEPGREVMVTCFPSIKAMNGSDPVAWDLLIIDECHLSETQQIVEAAGEINPTWRVGFSATPYRSDEKTLSLWHEVVYSYRIGEALRDGILVPWETIHPERGGIDLDEACLQMLRDHPPVGAGIIGAKSVVDAEEFAETLCTAGIPAEAVHSGLSRAQFLSSVKKLREGKIKAIVHVNMLTTGVDMPFLKWLMLRRKYNSRTSFLQFFGRGLRSSAGKEKVVIYDPWMQLEDFSLEYAASIGGESSAEPPAVVAPPEDEEEFDLFDLPEFDGSLKIPEITAKRAASAWVRAVLQAAQAANIVKPSPYSADSAWRKKPPTEKQLSAVEKISWGTKHLPAGNIRDGIKKIIQRKNFLSAGAVSDLIDTLLGGLSAGAPARTQKRHWEWEAPMPIPPLPARVFNSMEKSS